MSILSSEITLPSCHTFSS